MRINGLGFYIKNLAEAKKKEHEAQDLLNRRKEDMQEAAMEALKADEESLEQQQALKLTALQQQHAAELQALQALGTERRARFQNKLDIPDVSCVVLKFFSAADILHAEYKQHLL